MKDTHMNMKKAYKENQGFTILYAVLIASLLLSIGLGIYSVASKTLLLSSAGSGSQIALFAADSGLECGHYWDLMGSGTLFFATSSASGAEPGGASGASCGFTNITTGISTDGIHGNFGGAGSPVAWVISGLTANTAVTTFDVVFDGSECAIVQVSKAWTGTTETTSIQSRGYDVCNGADPLRVERGLEADY